MTCFFYSTVWLWKWFIPWCLTLICSFNWVLPHFTVSYFIPHSRMDEPTIHPSCYAGRPQSLVPPHTAAMSILVPSRTPGLWVPYLWVGCWDVAHAYLQHPSVVSDRCCAVSPPISLLWGFLLCHILVNIWYFRSI